MEIGEKFASIFQRKEKTQTEVKESKSNGISRRQFLKLMIALALTGVSTGAVRREIEVIPDNDNEIIGVEETDDDEKTTYRFFLKKYPQGQLGDQIKSIQEKTKKDSFSIISQKDDPYLKSLTDQVLTPDIVKQFQSTARADGLQTVTRQIFDVFRANKINYYNWFDSKENLERFFTFSEDLGQRLQYTFTCFEGAVFTKEVFKKLGINTEFNFMGIHTGLACGQGDQRFIIEPLMGTAMRVG